MHDKMHIKNTITCKKDFSRRGFEEKMRRYRGEDKNSHQFTWYFDEGL